MACANTRSKNLDDHDKPRRSGVEILAGYYIVYWVCDVCGFAWTQVTKDDPRKK